MLGRVNHIAIAVPDLAVATAAYRDTLGAAVSQPQALPEHGVTVVFVELPNTKVELLQPLGATSPIAAFLEKNPSGGMDRAQLAAGLDRILGYAQRAQENKLSGQSDIFGSTLTSGPEKISLPPFSPWLPSERLLKEFQVLGFYLTAHPLDSYNNILQKMRVQTFAEFSAAIKQGAANARLAGTVISKQERKTRTGNKMGIIVFSDSSGQFEAVLFSEMLNQYRDVLESGKSFVLTATGEERPEGIGLRIQTIQSLEEKSLQMQKALRVYVRDSGPLRMVSGHLNAKGDGLVSFIVIKEEGKREVEVALPEKYRITPEIAAALRAAPGVVDVELV